jgi:antitoxin component of MazEF toxin-antitoxin module
MESKKLIWKRYIVRVHNTFYLSLPPAYVQSMQLDKDDEIDVQLNQDGSLTLVPKEAA